MSDTISIFSFWEQVRTGEPAQWKCTDSFLSVCTFYVWLHPLLHQQLLRKLYLENSKCNVRLAQWPGSYSYTHVNKTHRASNVPWRSGVTVTDSAGQTLRRWEGLSQPTLPSTFTHSFCLSVSFIHCFLLYQETPTRVSNPAMQPKQTWFPLACITMTTPWGLKGFWDLTADKQQYTTREVHLLYVSSHRLISRWGGGYWKLKAYMCFSKSKNGAKYVRESQRSQAGN